MTFLQQAIFESLAWADPFLASWLSGFVVVLDGRIWLTRAGAEYLEGVGQ